MIGCPALSPKQLRLTLKNLNGQHALRNRALVMLGVRSGLRISELLALKVGRVWDGNGICVPAWFSATDEFFDVKVRWLQIF